MDLRRRRLSLWVPAALALAAALVLFVRLGQPDRIIFDETYYVNDARQYLETGVEDSFAVHPPVGKWLIGAGIAVFGDDPFGWRSSTALAGLLTALATYRAALVLFGRRLLPAALAGGLLVLDGLFIVQSRTAMLDAFLMLFVMVGAWAVLEDATRAPNVSARISRPWLLGAGLAFGLAFATKWSGVFGAGAGGLLFLLLESGRLTPATPEPADDPEGPDDEPARDEVQGHDVEPAAEPAVLRLGFAPAALGRALGTAAVPLIVVPLVVYALSWIPWLANYDDTTQFDDSCGTQTLEECDPGLVERVRGLQRHHGAIYRFHVNLDAEHSYRAPATGWLVMQRPVVYYYETCNGDRAAGIGTTLDDGTVEPAEPCEVEEGQAAEIIALGNPALWWTNVLALIPLLAGAARRDWRAVAILLFYAGQYLPWLRTGRPLFFFYNAPIVPFIALSVVYAIVVLHERRDLTRPAGVAAAAGLTGLAAGVVLPGDTSQAFIGAVVGLVAGAFFGALPAKGAPIEDVPVVAPTGPMPGSPSAAWERLTASPGGIAGALIAVLALIMFVYWIPLWIGLPMSEDYVRDHWWFRSWI